MLALDKSTVRTPVLFLRLGAKTSGQVEAGKGYMLSKEKTNDLDKISEILDFGDKIEFFTYGKLERSRYTLYLSGKNTKKVFTFVSILELLKIETFIRKNLVHKPSPPKTEADNIKADSVTDSKINMEQSTHLYESMDAYTKQETILSSPE